MAGLAFRDFVSGPWKTGCYDRCKASTRRRMDSALKAQLLPSFGPSALDQISGPDVHRWFDHYSRTAPAGANRTLDVLRQIFNYAISCGHVAANPTRGVKRNHRPTPNRFLSRNEIDRLRTALDAHRGRGSGRQQAEIIRLLLLTGCRKSELVSLRWCRRSPDRRPAPAPRGSRRPAPAAGGTPAGHSAHPLAGRDARRDLAAGPWRTGRLAEILPAARRRVAA